MNTEELQKEIATLKEEKAKLISGLKLAVKKLDEADIEIQRLNAEVTSLDQEAQELLNEKIKLNDLCSEYKTKYIGLKTIMDFATK